MNIQSLSVDIPAGCPNNCGFCVSKMHHEDYPNLIFKKYEKTSDKDFIKNEYMKRLEFARDNGCNTLLITSTGEPTTELHFIADLIEMNKKLSSPFKIIELQTSGIKLGDKDFYAISIFLEISTISLSLSNIF
jgi:pyruvate-formate lyase-activating enzyme